jgi:hypothetical protein
MRAESLNSPLFVTTIPVLDESRSRSRSPSSLSPCPCWLRPQSGAQRHHHPSVGHCSPCLIAYGTKSSNLVRDIWIRSSSAEPHRARGVSPQRRHAVLNPQCGMWAVDYWIASATGVRPSYTWQWTSSHRAQVYIRTPLKSQVHTHGHLHPVIKKASRLSPFIRTKCNSSQPIITQHWPYSQERRYSENRKLEGDEYGNIL